MARAVAAGRGQVNSVSRAEYDSGGGRGTCWNARDENIRNGRAARANLSLAKQRNTKWGGKIPCRKVAEVVKRDSGPLPILWFRASRRPSPSALLWVTPLGSP